MESIEVVPSEEGGNGLPSETPSPPPAETPEASPASVEPAKPVEPEVELFELPDGRKVDAETLTKEWKQNFAPEFTRRSQELAELKKGNSPLTETKPANPLADPNWVPGSYAELVQVAKQEMEAGLEAKEQARIEQQKAIEDAVVSQLTEVKKLDPTLNENALFLHANKYGFRDLRVAHQNMRDMSELAKNVQKTTATNIAKRTDPVSVSPGATGARPDPSQFATARDYVRSLK